MSTNIRDMATPSGADVEAFVNQQLAKMSKAMADSATYRGAAGADRWLAQDYDIKCNKIPEYPGHGWEFVEAISIGSGQIAVVWRKSRVIQAQQGEEAGMKLTAPKTA